MDILLLLFCSLWLPLGSETNGMLSLFDKTKVPFLLLFIGLSQSLPLQPLPKKKRCFCSITCYTGQPNSLWKAIWSSKLTPTPVSSPSPWILVDAIDVCCVHGETRASDVYSIVFPRSVRPQTLGIIKWLWKLFSHTPVIHSAWLPILDSLT